MDSSGGPTELAEISRRLKERVGDLERRLAEKNELIENLTSKLDQYQSVVGHISSAAAAGGGRRRQRALGISAEPHREQLSLQHLQPKNVFVTYPKSQRLDRITRRSFCYASSHLLNRLPHSLRQPRLDLPLPDSSLLHDHLISPVSSSPLLSRVTPSFFLANFKTFSSFPQIVPSIGIWHLRTDFTDVRPVLPFFSSFHFFRFCYRYFLF